MVEFLKNTVAIAISLMSLGVVLIIGGLQAKYAWNQCVVGTILWIVGGLLLITGLVLSAIGLRALWGKAHERIG